MVLTDDKWTFCQFLNHLDKNEVYTLISRSITQTVNHTHTTFKQLSQCTCNVIFRSFRVTFFLQWKSSKCYIFWVCLCSFSYPACKAHASYCHLRAVRLYRVFQHYLTNGTIFEKKVIGHKMCVSVFSITFVWNISHYKNKWKRYDQKCVLVFT